MKLPVGSELAHRNGVPFAKSIFLWATIYKMGQQYLKSLTYSGFDNRLFCSYRYPWFRAHLSLFKACFIKRHPVSFCNRFNVMSKPSLIQELTLNMEIDFFVGKPRFEPCDSVVGRCPLIDTCVSLWGMRNQRKSFRLPDRIGSDRFETLLFGESWILYARPAGVRANMRHAPSGFHQEVKSSN